MCPCHGRSSFGNHLPRHLYGRNLPWFASGEPKTAGPRGAGPGSRACDFSRRSGHREEGPAARPTTDECHVRSAARTAWSISCAERRLAAFRVPVTPPAPDGIRAVPDSEDPRGYVLWRRTTSLPLYRSVEHTTAP